MKKYDAFVSYSSADQEFCLTLCERLRSDGINLWLDHWSIETGDSIPVRIQEGLENSQKLLLLISPNGLKSAWSTMERNCLFFQDPLNSGRGIVPVLIESCHLPILIANLRHIDYRTRSDAAYAEILRACSPPVGLVCSDGVATIRLYRDFSDGGDVARFFWNERLQSTYRRAIIIDFTHLEYASSGGPFLFLASLHKKVSEINGRLALCGVKSELLEVLRITKLNRILNIFQTRVEALQYVRSNQ
jgi:anti-anti-sigma factor